MVMKKFYSAPIVEIEKFDIADVITASTAYLGADAQANASATDNAYAEAVGIAW